MGLVVGVFGEKFIGDLVDGFGGDDGVFTGEVSCDGDSEGVLGEFESASFGIIGRVESAVLVQQAAQSEQLSTPVFEVCDFRQRDQFWLQFAELIGDATVRALLYCFAV